MTSIWLSAGTQIRNCTYWKRKLHLKWVKFLWWWKFWQWWSNFLEKFWWQGNQKVLQTVAWSVQNVWVSLLFLNRKTILITERIWWFLHIASSGCSTIDYMFISIDLWVILANHLMCFCICWLQLLTCRYFYTKNVQWILKYLSCKGKFWVNRASGPEERKWFTCEF